MAIRGASLARLLGLLVCAPGKALGRPSVRPRGGGQIELKCYDVDHLASERLCGDAQMLCPLAFGGCSGQKTEENKGFLDLRLGVL